MIKKIIATTGIALGITALGATSANAEVTHNWDALAECESGGNWSINTGNGFHGGIQFSPSTWNGYGGQEFAPYAYQATREQQIIIGERTLASQGPGAWPACQGRLWEPGANVTIIPPGAESEIAVDQTPVEPVKPKAIVLPELPVLDIPENPYGISNASLQQDRINLEDFLNLKHEEYVKFVESVNGGI